MHFSGPGRTDSRHRFETTDPRAREREREGEATDRGATTTCRRGPARPTTGEAIVAIEWRKDADAALEEAADRGLPLLIDFNAAPD